MAHPLLCPPRLYVALSAYRPASLSVSLSLSVPVGPSPTAPKLGLHAHRLQSNRRRRAILTVLALIAALLPAANALGQTYFVTTGTFMPRSGAHVIGGTQLPWYDRFGNFVTTLSGSFQVTGGYPPIHANSITVTVNGLSTYVTEDPNNMSAGTWVLSGSYLNVGNSATIYWISIAYSKPGVNLQVTNPGPFPWYIYTVYPYTVWNPSYSDTAHDDVVNTTNNLRFGAGAGPGGCDLLDTFGSVAFPPGNGNARQIFNGFNVWAPPSIFDRPPITVGIMQTFENTIVPFGTVTYYQIANPSATGTETLGKTAGAPNPPWWDGDPTTPTYYGAESRHGISGDTPIQVYNTYEWIYGSSANGNTVGLVVDDSPDLFLFNGYIYQGYAYNWGTSGGIRQIGGQAETVRFTDMLVATSGDVPGVFVPIYGYYDWSVTYAGSQTGVPPNYWTDGSVASNGTHPSTQPVTTVSRGPMNSLLATYFGVP